MRRLRSNVVSRTALLGIVLGAFAAHGHAQAPAASPRTAAPAKPHKSVYRKLERVDAVAERRDREDVDEGEAAGTGSSIHPVIAELDKFKSRRPGDRDLPPDRVQLEAGYRGRVPSTAERPDLPERDRVPGHAAEQPHSRQRLHGREGTGPVTESMIPTGGLGKRWTPAWCCAVQRRSCTPATSRATARPSWFSASSRRPALTSGPVSRWGAPLPIGRARRRSRRQAGRPPGAQLGRRLLGLQHAAPEPRRVRDALQALPDVLRRAWTSTGARPGTFAVAASWADLVGLIREHADLALGQVDRALWRSRGRRRRPGRRPGPSPPASFAADSAPR